MYVSLGICLSLLIHTSRIRVSSTMMLSCTFPKSSFTRGGCRLFATHTFPDIPGLIIQEDYLDQELHANVFKEARHASDLAEELAIKRNETFVSPAHNIPIRSKYVPVKIPLKSLCSSSSTNLSAEHFSHYGEGHRLTYYRGNENIPGLGLPSDFLDELAHLDAIKAEVKESRRRLGRSTTAPTKWRLTLNHYRGRNSGRISLASRFGGEWRLYHDTWARQYRAFGIRQGAPCGS